MTAALSPPTPGEDERPLRLADRPWVEPVLGVLVAAQCAVILWATVVSPRDGSYVAMLDAASHPVVGIAGIPAAVLLVIRHRAARTWGLAALALLTANWFAAMSLASDFSLFVFGLFEMYEERLKIFAYGIAPVMMALNGAALWMLIERRSAALMDALGPYADEVGGRRGRW